MGFYNNFGIPTRGPSLQLLVSRRSFQEPAFSSNSEQILDGEAVLSMSPRWLMRLLQRNCRVLSLFSSQTATNQHSAGIFRGELPFEQVGAYHVTSLDRSRLQHALITSEGPVYLVYPRPSWSNLPDADVTRIYETPPYEYTIMSVAGSYVDTNSKFTFYLNDRQLVVYRVGATT